MDARAAPAVRAPSASDSPGSPMRLEALPPHRLISGPRPAPGGRRFLRHREARPHPHRGDPTRRLPGTISRAGRPLGRRPPSRPREGSSARRRRIDPRGAPSSAPRAPDLPGRDGLEVRRPGLCFGGGTRNRAVVASRRASLPRAARFRRVSPARFTDDSSGAPLPVRRPPPDAPSSARHAPESPGSRCVSRRCSASAASGTAPGTRRKSLPVVTTMPARIGTAAT